MADEQPKLVAVEFLQKQSPYNAGEIAGFSPEIAKLYVDSKVAAYCEPAAVAERSLTEEEIAVARARGKKIIADAEGNVGERFLAYLGRVEKERDALKERVLDLEVALHAAGNWEKDRGFLTDRIAELQGQVEEARAQAAAKPAAETAAPAGPVDQSGAPIDVSKKDDPLPGEVSQERAGGKESAAAGSEEAAGSRKKR